MSEKHDPQNPKITSEQLAAKYAELASIRKVARYFDMDRKNVGRRLNRYWTSIGHKNEDGDIPNFVPGMGRQITKVSKTLDSEGNVRSYAVQEQAQHEGDDAFQHPLDKLKRVSTLRGADGSIRAQWQITVADEERTKEAYDQIIEGFQESIPRAEPVPPPSMRPLERLHNNYVLSDAHIGALAWAPESGADWDLKIAESMWVKAMGAMIAQSPPAESCTVALLGDFMHYDKLEAVTTLSSHVLDSDGRQQKMNKVAIRVARQLINMALQHHPIVELLVAEGNHDIIGANWLREVFIVAYENEPRVSIIDSPKPYYATLKGGVFHGWHHGHLKGAPQIKSAEQLTAIFADEFRELWGQATKVYINTGHYHNLQENSVRGARVIQHPTLAARGSYEVRNGYNALREAIAQTFHDKYGQTGTVRVSPEMLEDEA